MQFFFLFSIFSRIRLLRNGECTLEIRLQACGRGSEVPRCWEPSPACSSRYFLRSPRLEAAPLTPRASSITPVSTPARGQAGSHRAVY